MLTKCSKPCKAIGPPKKAITCNHMWAKLMKKIQPAVPTFLAVAMSFAVQGDWAIAFCRQFVFFFPGPKAGGLYKPNWTQPNSELKQNIAWNLILSAVCVFWFISICIFLCFLFFFVLIFLFIVISNQMQFDPESNPDWFVVYSSFDSFPCSFLPSSFLPFPFVLPIVLFVLCSSFLRFLDHPSVPI